MARLLPASEAPLRVKFTHEVVSVEAGYIICFEASGEPRPTLYDYPYWPVKPRTFSSTYRAWDEPDWTPTAAQQHLLSLGCKPYYKHGVWGKQISDAMYVQSIESSEPVYIEAGMWLLVDVEPGRSGPYYNGDAQFRRRYIVAEKVNHDA